MTKRRKKSIAIALSGGGRTLANLLQNQARAEANYEIQSIISSKPKCGGNTIARDHGLPLFVGEFKPDKWFETSQKLKHWIEEQNLDLIVLAGFLAQFPIEHDLKERILNIHPALLPKFGGSGMYGMHVHRAVIESGDKVSGATVHKVTEEYDKGRVLGQVRVKVGTKCPEELAQTVFEAECDLYPRILNGVCSKETIDLDSFSPIIYDFEPQH